MLYKVAIMMVERMERKISGYLWRCLGLPKSLSCVVLYGTTNAIQLPFRGLKEEFVVTHTREAILYRDSRDLKVSGAGIEICTGRKWSAARELKVVEEGYGRYSGQRGKRPGILSESQDRQRQKERKKGALTKRSKRRHGKDYAGKDGRTFSTGCQD